MRISRHPLTDLSTPEVDDVGETPILWHANMSHLVAVIAGTREQIRGLWSQILHRCARDVSDSREDGGIVKVSLFTSVRSLVRVQYRPPRAVTA